MEDQLRLFFESLRTEADLERLRAEGREQDLHLEFMAMREADVELRIGESVEV